MTPYETAVLLDVENNFAFLPHVRLVDGKPTPVLTFCNCYATCWCAARGAKLPPLLANKQALWLISEPGRAEGWRQVDRARALDLANAFETVVAVATSDGHGHIGGCVESPDDDRGSLYITAAGARNYTRVKLEKSFGFLPPFFFHLAR